MFDNSIYEQKPDTTQLVVNCYELNIEGSKKIYRYRVEFKGDNGLNIVEDLFDRVSKCTAQEVLQKFFDEVVELDSIGSRAFHESTDEKDLYVFDHQNLFAYSTSVFESVETDPIVSAMFLNHELWEVIAKDNESISVKLTRDVDLNSHGLYEEYRQFLEVLTWQSTLKDMRSQYYVLDDGAYKRADAFKLENQGRIGRTGFKKRITMTETKYYLQLLPHNEIFFPVQTIYSYLIRELNTTDVELAKCLAEPQCLEAMLLHLDSLIVYDRILKTTFRIKEFHEKPIRKIDVEYNGKKIKLHEWYEKVYGHITANKNIPCAVNYGEKISYSLLENLDIVDGQYGQGQFEVNETSESLVKFQTLKQGEVIRRMRELTIAEKSRKHLNAFGIKIASLPTMVKYTELSAPEVVYGDGFVNVRVDNSSMRAWELSGSYRFHRPSDLVAGKSWALIKLVDGTFTEKKQNIFVGHLNRFGKALQLGNLQLVKTSLPFDDIGIYKWCEQLMTTISTGRAVMIVVASDKWKAKTYKTLKFFENQMGIVTVFVSELDASQNNWKPVIARVAHKVNARLGGANFVLNTSKATKLNGLEQVYGSLNNMQFFGIFYQRVDHDFNCIGVAYTKDSALTIGGSCWMDKKGIDNNDRLINEIYDAIVAWSKVKRGRMPTDILIFTRTSEEATFLLEILEKVEEKLRLPSITVPKFFIVSIDVECTECFLPTNWFEVKTAESWKKFPAGTCVDRGILNRNTFLLITSWPLVHASAFVRPSKFTVKPLASYCPDLSTIEYLCYYLCAVHPVERHLISLPLPLRAATDFGTTVSANLSTLKFLSQYLKDDPFADDLNIDERCEKINRLIERRKVPYFCA
ncbi:hypothetical protein M3Y96_01107500 [Aphelenchoides besseyi]|nr:hypothetical protein M3Y96_01107500 [Aphelenchoides besseyi]